MPSLSDINIAYISDDNFLMPTYVSVSTLFEKRDQDAHYNIYIICPDISDGQFEIFNSMQSDGFSVKIIDVKDTYENFKITKDGFHVSPAAILKFSLPDLLPQLEKILYIDGDTIINDNLFNLHSVDVGDYYAAVVEDIKPTKIYKPNLLHKLGIPHHKGYFNSGMLLLNLKKMRSDNITTQLFRYREKGVNFFMDQDAFNVVFQDQVKYLSCKNNLLITLEEDFSIEQIKDSYAGISHLSTFEGLVDSAAVVHFASKNKPWKTKSSKHGDKWHRQYLKSNADSKSFKVSHEVGNLIRQDIVVSLTSYPARIGTVTPTIKSLLSQTYQARKIVLWLAEDQFPNKEKDLPFSLVELISDKFSIMWCEDLLSYKKLIPALSIYPTSVIVTADDDILYANNWLLELVVSYLQDPSAIHCHRAHAISLDEDGKLLPYKKWKRDVKSATAGFTNFFTGCGGVLYPPSSLHADVTRKSIFASICSHGDDIWFWGMAVLKNTKIKIVADSDFELNFIQGSQENALWVTNDGGGRNDIMLNSFMETYPSVMGKVLEGYKDTKDVISINSAELL